MSDMRGQAMMEFALLVPILLLLLLGALQFGFIIQQYIAVVTLGREGARYASVNSGKPDSDLAAYITSIAPPSLTKSNLSFSFSPTPAASRLTGNPLAVGIQYNFSGKLFLPTSFFGWSLPTTFPLYTVTMRIEKL